jgi:hypothetical protein
VQAPKFHIVDCVDAFVSYEARHTLIANRLDLAGTELRGIRMLKQKQREKLFERRLRRKRLEICYPPSNITCHET